MVNKRLQRTLLEAVDNQVEANDPPITRTTLERLQNAGYSEREAKKKIAAVLVEEIFGAVKHGQAHDEKRYAEKLSALK